MFTVNSPIDAEIGEYFVTLGVKCQEINSSFTYQVEVVGGEFELNIRESRRVGTKLNILYSLENFAEDTKNLEVFYKLLDSDGSLIVEGEFDSLTILSEEVIEKSGDFELPKNSIGDYTLIMYASDGLDNSQKEHNVKLTIGGISGFAISENNLRTVTWFGIVIVLCFGLFIVFKGIMRQIALRKVKNDQNRQFITIDLKN